MYADAYLAQTDGAYSAACGRRVPSRQKPQALSMTSGLLRRTGSRPCSRPSGSPSCALVVGVISLCVDLSGLTGGGGPSALRWMAAGAEFPCGVLGGCGLSALRWMVAGAEFPCGVPGGCGHRRCGGCSGMRFWRFLSKGFC